MGKAINILTTACCIICIILTSIGIYLYLDKSKIIATNLTGYVTKVDITERPGEDSDIEYDYTISLDKLSQSCKLQLSYNEYSLHEKITGLNLYSDGTCSTDCSDGYCSRKLGIIAICLGSAFGLATIIMASISIYKKCNNNGYTQF
jgi:hypothetical protein